MERLRIRNVDKIEIKMGFLFHETIYRNHISSYSIDGIGILKLFSHGRTITIPKLDFDESFFAWFQNISKSAKLEAYKTQQTKLNANSDNVAIYLVLPLVLIFILSISASALLPVSYQFINWTQIIIPSSILGIILSIIIAYWFKSTQEDVNNNLLTIAFICSMFLLPSVFSLLFYINIKFDKSVAEIYHVHVISQSYNYSKRTKGISEQYLRVSGWINNELSRVVKVELHETYPSTVCIKQYQGTLHYPWFKVKKECGLEIFKE
jgi:hypothetical protein